jgi:hypothetical protein
MQYDSFQADCTELHRCLAQMLLIVEEGYQLPSTRELSDRFHTSLGSISAALNNLEEIGAVALTRRGRLGTILAHKSMGLLWKITEKSPMVVALTLPSFPKSEGLATAIYTLLDRAGIETYLIFIRGSLNRLKALRDGRCHAVAASLLAAEELCGEREEIILSLPPQSFVTDHCILYRKDIQPEGRPLRVGIDLDSFDIKLITELEFAGMDVEFFPMSFVQADRNFDRSQVDAAISNHDHVERRKSDSILSRPLSPAVQQIVGDRDTSAAIITRSGEPACSYILKRVLIPSDILTIQQKVVDGLMVPRY